MSDARMAGGSRGVKLGPLRLLLALPLLMILSTCTDKEKPAVAHQAPIEARTMALADIADVSKISEIYRESSMTLDEWRKLEPSNTSALKGRSGDEVVFGVLIKGHFEILGPPVEGFGKQVFSGGRVIFDRKGTPLVQELWKSANRRDRVFSSAYDDA